MYKVQSDSHFSLSFGANSTNLFFISLIGKYIRLGCISQVFNLTKENVFILTEDHYYTLTLSLNILSRLVMENYLLYNSVEL